jgi:hypothetical protein
MALIDNEEAARRLARVIISDIELYEKKKMQAGDDLTAPLAEGRALFRRRVVPELASIFEAVAEAKRSGASTGGPVFTPSPAVAAPRMTAAAAAPPAVERHGESTSPREAAVEARTVNPAAAIAERAAGKAAFDAGATGLAQAKVAETRVPEADRVEARLDDARPIDQVLADTTARVSDLAAEAAAARHLELPSARTQAREVSQDDRITPVPVEDVVARRPGAREPSPSPRAAKPPEAPQEPSSPLQQERVTLPVAFPAVTTMPEEEAPIPARPLARSPAAAPPMHTPAPARAPAVAPPAATVAAPPPPPPAPARAPTPQPIVVRREPPPAPRGPADRTPVPMSVSLAAAASAPAPLRLHSSPSGSSVALATLPSEISAGLAVKLQPTEDIVNLRARTSKFRVLLYIVATAGGLALIGRFLTRFL